MITQYVEDNTDPPSQPLQQLYLSLVYGGGDEPISQRTWPHASHPAMMPLRPATRAIARPSGLKLNKRLNYIIFTYSYCPYLSRSIFMYMYLYMHEMPSTCFLYICFKW